VPVGAFFGKSGGRGGGINEEPNTLRSRQVAKVIDLLGEGPIWGLVDGLKSITFDGVPVQNTDGTFNAKGIAVSWVKGYPDQLPMPGFTAVQQEIPVGVQVKTTTPQTRRISNTDCDRVRVTVSVNGLSRMLDSGDMEGSKVRFTIYLQSNNGGFVKLVSN